MQSMQLQCRIALGHLSGYNKTWWWKCLIRKLGLESGPVNRAQDIKGVCVCGGGGLLWVLVWRRRKTCERVREREREKERERSHLHFFRGMHALHNLEHSLSFNSLMCLSCWLFGKLLKSLLAKGQTKIANLNKLPRQILQINLFV